ncbi:MAG: 2-hydroxychromene-2-carboxylate isomerase [Candidatus Competibacterales bacterium]
MTAVIDYYLTPQSPWAYLGGERLHALARGSGAIVRVKPVDLGQLFRVSGGVPLAERPPQRQAYRRLELGRWSRHLQLPLNLEPACYPTDPIPASQMIIAAAAKGVDALALATAIGRALWAEQRDIKDPAVLIAVADALGLAGEALVQEAEKRLYWHRFQSYTDEAIAAGVFGVPSYIYRGELFFGQDRLAFLSSALGVE